MSLDLNRNSLSSQFILLVTSTLVCIGITIGFLQSGYTIIYQNFYYAPIILACFFYLRKGFIFSCILSLVYFGLMIIYTRDNNIVLEAGVRVIIFVGIAGVVTYLSEIIRKSERKLRKMLTFQEKITSNASVWLMVFDGKGIIHLWNAAAELISGYKKEEIQEQKSIWKKFQQDPIYKELFKQMACNANQSLEEFKSIEAPIQTKSGEQRIISWILKELPETEGEDGKYLAIGIDITDKKQNELELKKSKERWSEIFSRNLNPIALYRAVNDGANFIFTDINPALEEIEQLRKEDIIGKKVTEIFPNIKEMGLFDVFYRVYKTGKPEQLDTSFYQDDRIEGWYNNSVYQLSTGELVATYEDLTEKKQTEHLIKEKNDYLENLITYANVPIIIWDPSLNITRINHANEELIGWKSEEILGKTPEMFIIPEQTDRIMTLLESTTRGDRLSNVEMDILRKDGSVRTVLWNSATLFSDEGNPIAVIAQGRDITEEKRLELENDIALTQIQRNMAQLAILNDEMRNPLSIIMGYADLHLSEEHLRVIVEQVHRIDDIVTNLDRRWLNSEKVLTAMRKHYNIQLSGSGGEGEDALGTGQGIMN
ncbi:PAS domain S-box protein [Methanospirillum sp.]|uniref:PAS domain S-box protein n=1 Tax=Methanospirillum sp. TaxID=45200 RepID=UPI00359F4CEC